ncbi:hypothetical protein HJFPF1_02013 [Paramyrothecium foliicola]|nr:hypothetical protein HJFPF1_02013 [Paramyrothecium foliicola]
MEIEHQNAPWLMGAYSSLLPDGKSTQPEKSRANLEIPVICNQVDEATEAPSPEMLTLAP